MIALLCATPAELKCALPLIAGAEEARSPAGTTLVKGRAQEQEVLALSAGVGKVPAAAGTRFLLDRYPLDSLLVYGAAGALSPDLHLGDLVIADEVIPGDVGVAHSGGFKTTGPGQCEEGRLIFYPFFDIPPAMQRRAREAAEGAGLAYRLGKVLTCDQMVFEPDLRSHLGEVFGALAVEMEGAAAAQVAAAEGLPCGVVRTISDELSHDLVGMERLLAYRGQARRNLWHRRFRLAVCDLNAAAGARELSRGMDRALQALASFLRSYLG